MPDCRRAAPRAPTALSACRAPRGRRQRAHHPAALALACALPWAAGAAAAAADTVAAPDAAPTAAATAGRAASAAGADAPAAAQRVEVHAAPPAPAEPAPAGTLRVDGEVLRRVPGSLGDPLKGLQALPGVGTAHDGSARPAIRGSRPEDTAFRLDGLPAGEVFHVGGLTSTLNPDLVARFDLHSAAFGAAWGDATGAVIDVSLRPPRRDRIGGRIDLGLLGGHLLAEGPVGERAAFVVSAQRSWLDLARRTARDGSEPDSDGSIVQMPRYHDWLARWLWQPAAGQTLRLHASGSADRLALEVPAGSRLATQQPALVGAGRFDSSGRLLAATWEGRWPAPGGGSPDRADTEASDATVARISLGQRDRRNRQQLGSALRVALDTRDRFATAELAASPRPAHRLAAGLALHRLQADYDVSLRDARCTEFSPDCDISGAAELAARDRADIGTDAVWASERWRFAPAWAATLGLRHEHNRYLRHRSTQPRLGLQWQAAPGLALSAGWGRHTQMPPGEQIVPVLGNPALQPLQAIHRVLGLRQQLDGLLGPGWHWQLEAYDKALSRLVVADPVLNYANAGSGRSRGIELLLQRDATATARWHGWLALSWARAQRRHGVTGEAFRMAYDQPLILNAVLGWRFGAGWELSGRWTLKSGLPDTAVTGTTPDASGRPVPVYGPLNGDRLPPYHRLDLRLEKAFQRDLSVYVELINAYDRRNVAGYQYSADYASRTPVRQLGLLPSAGVNIGF